MALNPPTGGDVMTEQRAPKEHASSGTRVRGLVRDHLHRLLLALLGFIAISATTLIVNVTVPYKIGAASLAVVGIGAILVSLGEPRAMWLKRRGLRVWAVAGPLLAAVAVLAVGYGLQPPSIDHQFPATLILLDASETMATEFDGQTKLSVATSRIERHVGRFELEQLGFASFGATDCDTREPVIERVHIARNQAGAVKDALPDVAATGRSNLVMAAIRAVALLHDFEGEQRVVLVTGGLDDECGGDLRDLRDDALHFNVPIPEFRSLWTSGGAESGG
jgi:hypothetical protein